LFVKQNSGGVFVVGERQTAMQNIGALSALWPSATTINTVKCYRQWN